MPTSTPTPLPVGSWPVMLTPMHDDGTVDRDGLAGYTDWLVRTGSAGLFPVALSGEMYPLTPAERVDVARQVVTAAAGRVPVVASAVGDGPEEVADAVLAMAQTGVAAVVLISSLLTPAHADDAAWDRAIDVVLERTGDVPLGVYECPEPYKRLLTPAQATAVADSGRFLFAKDTSQDPDRIADRVRAGSGSPLRVYNAEIGSLLASLRGGGHGFSGWANTVYPDLVAWLCASWDTAPTGQVEAVQQALTVAESVLAHHYPASAKHQVARRSGVAVGTTSRWRPADLTAPALRVLDSLEDHLAGLDLPGWAPDGVRV